MDGWVETEGDSSGEGNASSVVKDERWLQKENYFRRGKLSFALELQSCQGELGWALLS